MNSLPLRVLSELAAMHYKNKGLYFEHAIVTLLLNQCVCKLEATQQNYESDDGMISKSMNLSKCLKAYLDSMPMDQWEGE